jgi:hypothetical protein
MQLFKSRVDDESPAYRNLRDLDLNVAHRKFAEELWVLFSAHAEPTFVDDLSREFHQRFWEMYVACGLLNVGLKLEPRSPVGPDLSVQTPDGRILWIEATVPTVGSGPDAVPELIDGTAARVPGEHILLRLRSAIEDKYKKYLGYLSSAIVSPHDYVTIALNGGLIPQSIFETDPPRILSALFPFGDRFVTIDRRTREVIDSGFRYRDHIAKKSGAHVPTTLFASKDYHYLGAVIYSNSDAGNHPAATSDVGSDFTVIHNPYAINPVPHGLLPCGREYVAIGDRVVCRPR